MRASGRLLLIGCLTTVLVVVVSGLSLAQRDRGRDDRGRDDRGGGLPDHVRRLDRNGNGMIERDEVPESWRSRWDPWLKQLGLDPNGTVSMRKLAERRERDERDRRENSGDADDELGVPGFGNEFEDEPVLGFGDEEEDSDWRSEYDRGAYDSARDTVRRYDRNRNGVLDRSEWTAVSWRSDPNESDLNRDGRLTLKEMTIRHDAHRRGQSSRGRGLGGDRDRGGSGQSSSRVVNPVGDTPAERILNFYKRYDRNGNGRFEPDEIAASSRLTERVREAGLDPKRSISVREFSERRAKLATSGGSGRGGRGSWGGGGSSWGGSRSASASRSKSSSRSNKGGYDPKDHKTYRYRTVQEQLPKGLQDWFIGRDEDEDGQVSMAEFTSVWSESKVDEFAHYDVNNDGLITATEALAQIETPYQGNGGRESFVSDPPREPAAEPSSSNGSHSPDGSQTSSTPASSGAREQDALARILRKNFASKDKNRDGVLEKSEWATSGLIKHAEFDANGDGKLPYEEFEKAYRAKYGK